MVSLAHIRQTGARLPYGFMSCVLFRFLDEMPTLKKKRSNRFTVLKMQTLVSSVHVKMALVSISHTQIIITTIDVPLTLVVSSCFRKGSDRLNVQKRDVFCSQLLWYNVIINIIYL